MERWHHLEPACFGAPISFLARGLKIVAMLDQIGAERAHRAVLLDRVAARHIDHRFQAIASRREGKALAVIAACRRDQSGCRRPLALETIDIDKAATHLEGADRCVVFMLDHDLCAESLREQRPAMRRRRRNRRRNDLMRTLELPQVKHLHLPRWLRSCGQRLSKWGRTIPFMITPAPCRRRTRSPWLRHWPPPATAFRCAPCRTGSSGSNSPAPRRGNRTAPAA
jgi:hypothetical protein